MSVRPRVVVLRGHHANIGELRPWELLQDRFEIEVVTTARADQQIDGLRVPWKTARTRRDRLPRGRLGTLATHLVGDAYLDIDALVREAAIVHTAELGPWFAAQPARLRQRYGFRLVTTVWETIPFRSTFRTARAAANRRILLSETDLFLPTTERARRCLLLEGAAPERIRVVEPGIDVERFATGTAPAGEGHLVVSPGRLVWEKGHYDVIRALAAIGGDARLLIVGSGPERGRLLRYADDLGLRDRVEIRPVPYDEMPSVFAAASCVVLASLPTKNWEEQFGLVLAEALAAGAPVLASSSGAIPEVLHGSGAPLFTPGRLARARRPSRRRTACSAAAGASRVPGRGRAAILDAGRSRAARSGLRAGSTKLDGRVERRSWISSRPCSTGSGGCRARARSLERRRRCGREERSRSRRARQPARSSSRTTSSVSKTW